MEKNSKVYSIFSPGLAPAHRAGHSPGTTEAYYCNFGLHPEYQQQIHEAGFGIAGSDEHKEARLLAWKDHPFFVAALFVPQHTSKPERPHPLLSPLIKTIEQLNILQPV